MQVHPIRDLGDPRLDPYRTLKTTNATRWSTGFIAEGRLVVERLLNSKLEVFSVLVSEKRWSGFAAKVKRDVPVWLVPHALASELVGFDFHAGIMAHGRRPANLWGESGTERLQAWLADVPTCTIVCCPNVTLPDNLGSIIRLAAAFHADGLLVTPQAADPFSRRCVRVSMGSVFQLECCESSDLVGDLQALVHQGFEIVAGHQSQHSVDARDMSWPAKVVLVLGNEATGIPAEIQEQCRVHVEISISQQIDSLNVSTAAAILLYERSRALRSIRG